MNDDGLWMVFWLLVGLACLAAMMVLWLTLPASAKHLLKELPPNVAHEIQFLCAQDYVSPFDIGRCIDQAAEAWLKSHPKVKQ